jgi:hypothetical protein
MYSLSAVWCIVPTQPHNLINVTCDNNTRRANLKRKAQGYNKRKVNVAHDSALRFRVFNLATALDVRFLQHFHRVKLAGGDESDQKHLAKRALAENLGKATHGHQTEIQNRDTDCKTAHFKKLKVINAHSTGFHAFQTGFLACRTIA